MGLNRSHVRWLILATLMVVTSWLAIACHAVSPPQIPTNHGTNCHPVEHAAGVTCVPNTIQRLVTLDEVSFEYAIALGFQPVGAALSQHSSYLNDVVAGVENIGEGGRPNLERVLTLKPDLIIGLDFNQEIYAQAAQIAPTLLVQFTHSGEWKDVFRQFSVLLNREAIAQRLMEQYHQRLQDLQTALKLAGYSAQGLPFPFQVSVVRIYPDTINLYFRDSFCGTILRDAGLARPPAQDLSAAEARQRFNNEVQTSISLEQVEQVDGDVMFIWTSENTIAADQSAQQKLAKLQQFPLWQRLNVINMERVYFVPRHWLGSGPLAANAVIDDLFKHLVKQS